MVFYLMLAGSATITFIANAAGHNKGREKPRLQRNHGYAGGGILVRTSGASRAVRLLQRAGPTHRPNLGEFGQFRSNIWQSDSTGTN